MTDRDHCGAGVPTTCAGLDDRATARLDGFSPGSAKIHVDIDPAEIDRTVPVDLGVVGDGVDVLEAVVAAWGEAPAPDLARWWDTIEG